MGIAGAGEAMLILSVTIAFLLLGVLWLAAVLHEHGLKPMRRMAELMKRPAAEIALVALVAIGMIHHGATKGTNGVNGAGGEMLNVANVEMLPIPNINAQLEGSAQLGNGNIGTGNNFTLATLPAAPTTNGVPVVAGTITAEDCAAGYVLSTVRTDETHSFDPPPDAVVCGDWLTFGAARDWFTLRLGCWALGSWLGGKVSVNSCGLVETLPGLTNGWIAPLAADLGIVPEANWQQILHFTPYTLHSLFWHCFTPSNTLQMTWVNALLDRVATNPVSFQCEVSANGDVEFRYDLSALADDMVSNVTVGVSCGAGVRAFGVLPKSVTSLRFARIGPFDAVLSDRDGDGIQTVDEVFLHHTDPGNPDTDYDGLSDSDEILVWHTDPTVPNSLRPDMPDGMAVKIGNENPWAYPEGSTNAIWEHVFYSGTTNGAFAYPQPEVGTAVLAVTVSGEGSGELVVGGAVVPLLAPPQMRSSPASSTLYVRMVKGVTYPVHLRMDGTLDLTVTSDDFAFGILPSASSGVWSGRINFPNTEATAPCIHDLNRCVVHVSLPASADAGALTCTWIGTEAVEVENRPPRAAKLVGRFSPKSVSTVTYRLGHPEHVLGSDTYSQTARFCPKPDDDDEVVEPEPGMLGGEGALDGESWFGGGDPVNGHADEWEADEAWEGEGSGSGDGTLSVEEGGAGNGAVAAWLDPGTCPVHGGGYEVCSNIHEQAYASAQLLQSVTGVLLLRSPPLYEPMHLDVPAGLPTPCCPCPDHNTNVVRACYVSGRLSVLDANGLAFRETAVPCDVYVGGVVPSAEVGDARLQFSHRGQICAEQSRTVFGVGISSAREGVDLAALNTFAPTFGLPVALGTNDPAANLNLDLKTMMTHGRVRLSVEGATARFVVAFRSPHDGAWHVLADSARQPVRDMPVQQWRRLFARDRRDAFAAPVAVMAAGTGTCDVKFTYWTVVDGKFAEDSAVQRITAVPPPLLADITRDGSIDAADILALVEGRLFRYWINEDTDKGDYVGHISGSARNASDHVVNGRLDLVNLFPVKLDLKPFIDAWGNAVRFQIYAQNGSFNFCGVDVSPSAAGTIQTEDVYTTTGDPLYAADLTEVEYEGVDIIPSEYLGNNNEPGVLAFEALEADRQLTLAVFFGDVMVLQFPLPAHFSSVRDMYRWNNMRLNCGGSYTDLDSTGVPSNLPDSETNGKDVFFIHGFNVSEANARNWANQVFKRLWLSGMRARFHGIAWYGDYRIGEDMNQAEKMNAFFYHQDVCHALKTAHPFKVYVESVQSAASSRIVMAHSLGNMVASEALREGLQVGKYFMFNAAVASEAYDSCLHDLNAGTRNSFVPSAWRDYAPLSWASNWHLLFPNDMRRNLRWKGLFECSLLNVGEVCNYYSSGDEVLEADSNVPSAYSNLFTTQWPVSFSWSWPFIHIGTFEFQFTFERNAWQKQEVLKGVNPYLARLDGGWGFHCFQDSTSSGTVWRTYTPMEAAEMIADGSIVTNAVFERSVATMFSPTNTLSEMYEVIAYNIPAVSYAVGSVATFSAQGAREDLNSEGFRNSWGRNSIAYGQDWLHSDMKDMAYYYVFPLYGELVEKIQGGQ